MLKGTCNWPGCSVAIVQPVGRGRPRKWCATHLRASSHRFGSDSRTRLCDEAWCERPVRARGVCNAHYKRILRAEGKLVSVWNDRRRNNDQTRRARVAGASTGEPVLLSDIIARDGLNCSICGEPVDLTVLWPDPLSKSIDHVVPIARGGIHDPTNCALAHLGCNIAKGDRVA